jgi:two-component system sensor histidine kinase KdpD
MKKLFPFRFTSSINQYVISTLVILVSLAICDYFRNYIGYLSVSFILLFIVSILSIFLGIGPILLASTLSALAWNYFFIPPHYTFHIGKPDDILIFFMFYVIVLLNGILTSRLRRQEKITREREERTNALYWLTHVLVRSSGINETIDIAKKYIQKYFLIDAVFIIQDGSNSLQNYKEGKKIIPISNDAFNAAIWTFRNSRKSGKYTDTLPLMNYTFYPLQGTRIKPGVVMVELNSAIKDDKEEFWNTFLAQISIAIEREFLNEQALKANLLDESDRLYKTLFNSISHELRIPVSAIIGASDTLIETNCNNELKNELAGEILKASRRLNRLIDNLLNISRLESGHFTLHLDWCDVHDLVNKVLENLDDDLRSFNLEVIIDDNIPLVKLDFGLMQQVLFNLLINTSQYAPVNTEIRIKAFYDHGFIFFQIMDKGPGFNDDVLPLVFNKFFRADKTRPGGIGLGLSIVKGFVEAHKGTVTAENRLDGGALFTIKIPTEIQMIDSGY